jgi:hypothetical protein
MFVVGANNATAKKTIILIVLGMLMFFQGTAVFGALLTMIVYVKPSPNAPRGFRIFGFPRAARSPN